MIEGLKPYAEYRWSGIPWASRLPAGWRIERAKRLFTKMERPVRPEDEVVTCFRDGVVTLHKNRRLRGFTEATVESGYQGIRKGDLVIHGMDAFAGAIGVSDSDGKGTPVYNVCQPRPGVVASFYAYTTREMSRAQWILALAKGIRERSTDFRYETFGNQFVPLPPPGEQAAIVRFLDHANRKIDNFIGAKRKLIALLNEQKHPRSVILDSSGAKMPGLFLSQELSGGGADRLHDQAGLPIPKQEIHRIGELMVGSFQLLERSLGFGQLIVTQACALHPNCLHCVGGGDLQFCFVPDRLLEGAEVPADLLARGIPATDTEDLLT